MYHTPHLREISEIVFQTADAWVGTEYDPSQEATGYALQEELRGGKHRATEGRQTPLHREPEKDKAL